MMALVLDSTTPGAEGVFNRLGLQAYALELLNNSRNELSSGSWAEGVDDVFSLFDGASAALLGTVLPLRTARELSQASLDSMASALQTSFQSVLIRMLADEDLIPRLTVEEAGPALIRALAAAGDYVDANTIGASLTMTSLAGDGTVVYSTLDGSGYPLENLLAETLRFRVVDTTTRGSEIIQVLGDPEAPGRLSPLWPAGSGAAGRYTSADPQAGAGLLTNGGMDTFTTANTPDDWTVSVGTPGTTLFSEDTTKYEGSHALKITGDGAQLTELRQTLPRELLRPRMQLAFGMLTRISATPSTGAGRVDLYDGSAVINDEAGTANSLSIDLTALTTSYAWVTAKFRLPDPLPETIQIRLRISTALENAKSWYADGLRLVEMTQPRAGMLGRLPYLAFLSGASPWSGDDGAPSNTTVFKLETTNNYAGKWQRELDRFLDAGRFGWRFPTSGGGSLINDSLIG